MTGHRHFNIYSNEHPLRKGVKRGQRSSHALHPLRRQGFRAQDLVEFALIFPVLMLFVFGIIDFGRVFHVLIVISNAAREGARYGMAYGIVCPPDPDDPTKRDCSPDYDTYDESIIDAASIQEAGNSNLLLTADQVTPSCPPIDDPVDKCYTGQPLRVEVTYTYQPFMSIVFSEGITLTREMEMVNP